MTSENETKSGVKVIKITRSSARFRDWFDEWCVEYKFATNYRGDYFLNGKAHAEDELVSKLLLDADDSSSKFGKVNLLQAVLTLKRYEAKEKFLNEMKEKILPYNPNIAIANWLQAVTGSVDPTHLAVMEQFVWLMKRKLLGLPVGNHLMPILYGAQGAGKSEAVKRITAVLSYLALESDVKQITDDRSWEMFQNFYVIFFDEVAKAETSCIDTVKRIITSSEISYRPMRTNKTVTIRNNSCFIGTSNKPVDQVFRDETGMRRYFEIKTVDRIDRDLINSIDYTLFFQAVDAHGPEPYQRVELTVRDHQESLRSKSVLEEWISEIALVSTRTTKIASSTLFQSYWNFCEDARIENYRRVNKFEFGRRLKHLGFEPTISGPNYKRQRAYFAGANGLDLDPHTDE